MRRAARRRATGARGRVATCTLAAAATVTLAGASPAGPASAGAARGAAGTFVAAAPVRHAAAPRRQRPLPRALRSLPGPEGTTGTAFGFAPGEERRYRLGPPEVLRPGEFETWTLRLEERQDEAGDAGWRATFRYTYEYSRTRAPGLGADATAERYRGEARVTVNEAGFPLRVVYAPAEMGGRVFADAAGDNGRMVWTGERFRLEPPGRTGWGALTVPLPDLDAVRIDVPAGAFLSERENPALLTLAASVMLSDDLRRMEYVALRPGEMAPGRRRGGFGNPGRLAGVLRASLEFAEAEEIDVGGRGYRALRLDSSENDDGDVWVDRDGRLLRLERRHRDREALVRLLHPTEY